MLSKNLNLTQLSIKPFFIKDFLNMQNTFPIFTVKGAFLCFLITFGPQHYTLYQKFYEINSFESYNKNFFRILEL